MCLSNGVLFCSTVIMLLTMIETFCCPCCRYIYKQLKDCDRLPGDMYFCHTNKFNAVRFHLVFISQPKRPSIHWHLRPLIVLVFFPPQQYKHISCAIAKVTWLLISIFELSVSRLSLNISGRLLLATSARIFRKQPLYLNEVEVSTLPISHL